MKDGMGFGSAQEMLEGARHARLDMVNMRHDAQVPGPTGALARICWFHVPELAKRMGAEINEDEGHPPSVVSSDQALVRALGHEIEVARPFADWLSHHIKPPTPQMFARGASNAFDVILDDFAKQKGFVRDDAIASERESARSIDPARVAAAQRAFGRMGQDI